MKGTVNMRALLLLALVGCVDRPADECSFEASTADLHPAVTTVADDTVTMSSVAWTAFQATEYGVATYMECRALPRCGEPPTFPTDTDRIIEFRGEVTLSYRDWERFEAWVTLAERWLECAE